MCSRHHHLYHCMAFWNGYSRRKKNFFQLLSLWMEIVSIEVKWGTQFSEFFKIQTSLGFLGALLIQSIKKMRQAWRKRETKTRFAQGSHAHPEEKRARGKTTDTKMGPDFSQLIFSIPLPFLSPLGCHISGRSPSFSSSVFGRASGLTPISNGLPIFPDALWTRSLPLFSPYFWRSRRNQQRGGKGCLGEEYAKYCTNSFGQIRAQHQKE